MSLHRSKLPTWQNSSIHECKVLFKPGVVEVVDVKVPLDKKHVLKERSGGVAAISHSFIEGSICDFSQQDYRLFHDWQHLLSPQIRFLKIAWKRKRWIKWHNFITYYASRRWFFKTVVLQSVTYAVLKYDLSMPSPCSCTVRIKLIACKFLFLMNKVVQA